MIGTTFVALDVETANADRSSICQVGLAHFVDGQLASEWMSFVNPEDLFDPFNVAVHGIDEERVASAPTFAQVAHALVQQLSGRVVVSHTSFDRSAIARAFEKASVPAPACEWLDSARVARHAWEDVSERGYGLGDLCARLGHVYRAHDALEDAKAAGTVLLAAMRDSGLDLAGWRERLSKREASKANPIAADGNPDGPLFGEVLVFTGELTVSRAEAAEMAARIGCTVAPGVTKKTTMLVIGAQDARLPNWNAKSSKQRKAEALASKGQHIHILSELDFERLVQEFAAEERST